VPAQYLDILRPQRIDCDARVAKGQELGWFEHGSTVIVFAPRGFALCPDIAPGSAVRMGQRLMRLPGAGPEAAASWGCHAPASTSSGITT
jgi:phosphatidylserine decarboxylase